MNVSMRGKFYNHQGRPECRTAPEWFASSRRLPDELVGAVRLNLEDVELRVQRVVGLRRPLQRASEDPVRDLHLLDVLEDGLASRRAVALGARELDRIHCDLSRAVARRG